MDNFAIFFIVFASLGIYLFWRLAKGFYTKLVGVLPKTDEGKKFVDGDSSDDVSAMFATTVENLEQQRLVLYGKTKGLFKRAFLRAWFLLASIIILLVIILSEPENIDIIMFIGPGIMAAFLSLIGAGIYTLVKKGNNLNTFSRLLKQDLVTEVQKVINPQLTFYDEGIEETDFDKADIFPEGKRTSLKSEDKIEGIIDGTKVVISECIKRGYKTIPTKRAAIKVKGVTVARTRGEISAGNEGLEYFRGLFIQLELKNINLTSVLKVIPQSRLKKEVKTGIEFQGRRLMIKKLPPEEKVDNIPAIENKPYEIYCNNKAQASEALSDKFVKILDFVYEKYNKKRESNSGKSMIGGMLFKERGVFISIRNNMLYMALDWNKDMFEPDLFLKKSLVESGIAQEIYEDLLFINQIVKEVNLFNKISVDS